MLSFGAGLTRSLKGTYRAGSSELIRLLLGSRSGGRSFERVVVVAALSRNDGIASGARLQYNALRQCGIDAELLDAAPALRNPLYRIAHRPGSAYIFHSGGPQTASLIGSVLPHAAHAWRIAYWAWELPDPPPDWAGCDRTVHEIWTPSRFSYESLARQTRRPIAIVPHHVPASAARTRNPRGPFTVLAMADSRSSLSRKNPEGALRAFKAAFGTSSAARLVLKLGGRQDSWAALARSAGELLHASNIEIVQGHLDQAALGALFRRCDVLLSLHRAEGFGLPMLEAMAQGIPVVATGWSGNLEFMSEADSHLVPYQLVEVCDAAAIYANSRWAEPDLEAAARSLRQLADMPEQYSRLAAAAHQRVARTAPRFPLALSTSHPAGSLQACA